MPVATAALPIDWISQTALRLGDAVGWPIAWNDVQSHSTTTVDCGMLPVVDGTQVVGRLVVEPPDDVRLQPAFAAACDVAHVFAGVLSRLATAQHQLSSCRRSVVTPSQLSSAPAQTDDLPTKMSGLLKSAVQSTGLWSAAFFLADPQSSRLRLRATYNLPAGSVPARCAEQQTVVRLNRRHSEDAAWLPEGFAVGMAVPVAWQSHVVGMLWCFDRRQRPLGEWEVQALQSVAAQIAVMLERSVLIEESAQRRQLKSDLKFASRTLPIGQWQPLPAECRLEVSVRTASVIEVGGDFCEVIPLRHRQTLIAIGDAVGHGIPAAMLASAARGALRGLIARSAPDDLTPQALMVNINRALHSITRSEHFVTLMLAILDARTGTLTYSNAGHPPPLMLREGAWQTLTSHGLFLGVSPEATYQATEASLEAGDVLVGFTDGVTETVNPSKQVFRRQGIRDTIRTADGATAEAIADSIWQRLDAHDPARPLRDDRTLLVMKYLGTG